MISLKAIQTSFTPTRHHHHRLFHLATKPSFSKTSTLCISDPNDSSSDPDQDPSSSSEAKEEATVEFDKIGEDALKDLDEATARIIEYIEGRRQSFEESAELNRIEIETNDNKVAEFEGQMVKDLNEGMFFKNLVKNQALIMPKLSWKQRRLKISPKLKLGPKPDRPFTFSLMAVLATAIAQSFISSTADWRKVAVIGTILVGLITQFYYKKRHSSELESLEKTDKENK